MFGKKKGDEGAPPMYKVVYRGGRAGLPKAKTGEIRLTTEDDQFRFAPTIGSKKFWRSSRYRTRRSTTSRPLTASTAEGLLGGLDSPVS